VHFFLGVYFFAAAAMDRTLTGIPLFASRPVDYLFRDF